MTLEETKSFFEHKTEEANRKSHIRAYTDFAQLCSILIDRPLTESQRNIIEQELKGYRLKALKKENKVLEFSSK